MAELRDWFKETGTLGRGKILPPHARDGRVTGFIYGHATTPDGHVVTPSILVGHRGNTIISQSGKEYDLGKPDPGYLAQYPNAKEELLATLPDLDQTQTMHSDSTQVQSPAPAP